MIRLPYTFNDFTPERWEELYQCFVTANRSHWKPAPFDAVKNLLEKKSRFEFIVRSMETWTCKFILVKNGDGTLETDFEGNEELTNMKNHIAKMKIIFEDEVKKIT